MYLLFLFVAALIVAAVLTHWFLDPRFIRLVVLDYPNERSLHARPIPRGGGMAILGVIVLATILGVIAGAAPDELLVLAVAGLVVAVTSFLDDRYSIAPSYRITIHIAAAVGVVYAGFEIPPVFWPGGQDPWPYAVLAVLTILFVVWMTNLYNFMDGMDGFAGGMTLWGFGAMALAGWFADHAAFAAANVIVAGAAAGFLLFNFPPARIFMGDVGSASLGFLAAGFSLWGVREGVLPFWAAVLLFSPFSVDATFTLVRRALRGERLWEAHRTHIYQRLVQSGWGHRKTVLWEYVLMVACAGSALWAARQDLVVQNAVILVWCFLYLGLITAVTVYERRRSRA
jgi:UDP-N-acetylmuramyl pentapeptide phosphotransferase/UDP-N-acetylglucosamine-1-phosphate transferase